MDFHSTLSMNILKFKFFLIFSISVTAMVYFLVSSVKGKFNDFSIACRTEAVSVEPHEGPVALDPTWNNALQPVALENSLGTMRYLQPVALKNLFGTMR